MAGVKGRSGRKSRYREIEEGKFQNICKSYLLDNFDKFDEKTKISIAKDVLLKSMPSQVNQEINQNASIELSSKQNDLVAQLVREQIKMIETAQEAIVTEPLKQVE